MPLEDIGAIEALFAGTTAARAETTDHCAFVVCESMPILVVFPSKALDMVFAGRDRAFLWPLILMREHVCFEVFDLPAAGWYRADALVLVG